MNYYTSSEKINLMLFEILKIKETSFLLYLLYKMS
jgi:hypothetical protein